MFSPMWNQAWRQKNLGHMVEKHTKHGRILSWDPLQNLDFMAGQPIPQTQVSTPNKSGRNSFNFAKHPCMV